MYVICSAAFVYSLLHQGNEFKSSGVIIFWGYISVNVFIIIIILGSEMFSWLLYEMPKGTQLIASKRLDSGVKLNIGKIKWLKDV